MSRPALAGTLPRFFSALLLLTALAVSAALAPVPAWALEVPPNRGQWVVDAAQLLPPRVKNQLAVELRRYAETSGNQIVVLTVPSLQGEEIAAFANRVARQWGVGQKDKNNGVLILLARAEGRVRFEVGRGIEDRLPDLLCKRIQEELMVPEFKARRFGPGLFKGVEAIEQALTPEPALGEDGNATLPDEPQPQGAQGGGPHIGFTLILAVLALFMFLGLLWKRYGRRYDPAQRRPGELPPPDDFFLWGFLFGFLGHIFGGRGNHDDGMGGMGGGMGGMGGGMGGGMDGGGFGGSGGGGFSGSDGGFSGGGGDFGGGGADSDFGGGGDSGGSSD